ncbi:topoisomerase IV [Isachenkonia alkalipeptolytica]|uniref:Topoisomerase IV n=1 Tax=Isachenkonia alkalipeptolytica TaxID=2565777 RepID=A0AA44BEM4_9CLOT|nr:topoisomerase IV [Isachenkonia alkalipeptolytica]NBG87686.1 topoisomerase IV [Isachenkonia alkalipeptolytica]
MELMIVIGLLLIIIAFVIINKKKNTKIEDAEMNSFELMEFEGDSVLLPIEKNPVLNLKEKANMVEITDDTVIARITQGFPNFANKAASTVTNKAIENAEIYKVIIPKGETLTKSKNMKNAYRGYYRNAKSIKGQANLVKVDPKNLSKATKAANIGANAVNVGALVVGQYYMAEINSKLETMSESISKISDFQQREFKSRITSLVALVGEVSQFSAEILENDELRERKLNMLEARKADAIQLLGQVNETITDLTHSNTEPNYKDYQKTVDDFNRLLEFQNVLIATLEEISKLTYLLGKGEISNELSYATYNKYKNVAEGARDALEVWHSKHLEMHQIDLSNNRRTKRGIEGYIGKIPVLKDEKWKYKTLEQGLAENINAISNLRFKSEKVPMEVYNQDVKIILKEGKYYYLPD